MEEFANDTQDIKSRDDELKVEVDNGNMNNFINNSVTMKMTAVMITWFLLQDRTY